MTECLDQAAADVLNVEAGRREDTKLVQEAKLMESYGAQALIIMDSAGAYLPEDVTERIKVLVNELNIPVDVSETAAIPQL